MSAWVLTIFTLLLCNAINAQNCSKEEYQRCVPLADPLLKDPRLIFPDNMIDIDIVCRTWASFVECIRKYIDNCLPKQKREQFNSAVEQPIESVHQMCTVSSYQTEYLQYASCIKATVTETKHCGNQYAALVSEVSRNEVQKTSLCCLHYHFRSCVITETRKRCDAGENSGPATRFSRQILDKALSFLQNQCYNYIPNSGDCPNLTLDNTVSLSDQDNKNYGNKNRHRMSSIPPENYAGQASDYYGSITKSYQPGFRSTGRALNTNNLPSSKSFTNDNSNNNDNHVNNNNNNNSPQEASIKVTTQAVTPDNVSQNSKETPTASTIDAISSGTAPTSSIESNANQEQPAVVVTQRSPSYGRGMSWTSPATRATSEIPAWATSTWVTSNQIPVTEDSWFPPAGSFGGNNIDEPNQQGLSKNGQDVAGTTVLYILLTVSILNIF